MVDGCFLSKQTIYAKAKINPIPTGIVSPLCGFFVLKFPEIHILTLNWVAFRKISYYTRKKQFFEI